jgi:acyl-CoA synthetase (AMP-forming)/AMP-acid ligase II
MNLAQLHEALAGPLAQRDCIVYGDKRFTWEQVTDRSRRFAQVLRSHGLGLHKERGQLQNWESGQSHVALYMYNCNEYMESVLGAYKCRSVPFNVNYRYQEEELIYLLQNADARAIVFHGRFAPLLENIRSRLPQIRLWLQVDDGSDTPLMKGAIEYEQALADSSPEPMDTSASIDDLFMIYTGGTTGMPKGVLWRQQDIFHALIAPLYPQDMSLQDIVDTVVKRQVKGKLGSGMAPPPFMHASGCCVALGIWFMGYSLVIQSQTDKFDADNVLSTMERENVSSIAIVGDGFGNPLNQQLQQKKYDLSAMRLISTGGAMLSEHNKRLFQQYIPGVIIFDVLGSSETGQQGMNISQSGEIASSVDFTMVAGSAVVNAARDALLDENSDETGWMAQSGHVALGYYKDADKTALTFPTICGTRYSIPGDRAELNSAGQIHLLGRESVTINTGGEKVFAEEVEAVIKKLSGVKDAQVIGVASQRWGQEVNALVSLADGQQITARDIKDHTRRILADYKTPKRVIMLEEIQRTATGKPDYEWAQDMAQRERTA